MPDPLDSRTSSKTRERLAFEVAMIFASPRLTIRHLQVDDFAAFHEMQSDGDVMRYVTGSGLTDQENERQLFECIQKYGSPQNEFRVWAADMKMTQQFVGTCALVINDSGENEIGYRLLKRYWGQGLGKELAKALIDYCLCDRDLDRIVAHADIRNLASIRILESTMTFVQESVHEQAGVRVRFYEKVASPEGRSRVGN